MPKLKRKAVDKNFNLQPAFKKINLDVNFNHKNNKIDISDYFVNHPKNHCVNGNHKVEIGDTYCNKYYVEKKLGFGACSTVWKCLDTHNKRHVALKLINGSHYHTEAAMLEIQVLRQIQPKKRFHRRCKKTDNREKKFNQLLDSFTISSAQCSHVCIVLELMEGSLTDLYFTPDGKKILSNNVRTIISQILEALDCLHTNCELIHTDLKADNVLYCLEENNDSSDSKITVKLSDFGSACSVHNPNSIGCQTIRFRSLEFFLGAPYGPSADIWSMACLAFFLATGFHLFDSKEGESYSLEEDHLACTIALLGDIPKHVALSGRYSGYFFTEDGRFKHKSTRKSQSLYEVLTEKCGWSANEAIEFKNFLLPMLNFNPEKRPSAKNSLKHPYLTQTT